MIEFRILTFLFLFNRYLRVIAITLLGSYSFANILIDVLFLAIGILVCLTRNFSLKRENLTDLIEISVVLIFAALQIVLFLWQGQSSLLVLSNARRYFSGLFYLVVVFFLFRNKSHEAVARELRATCDQSLGVILFFLLAEYIGRTASPALNGLFLNAVVVPVSNLSTLPREEVAGALTLYKWHFGGSFSLLRTYGIGLDYFVSGSLLILVYAMRDLLKRGARIQNTDVIISILVGFGCLLSGTSSVFLLYLLIVFNHFIPKNNSVIAILLLPLFAVFFIWYLLPGFNSENGYFLFLGNITPYVCRALSRYWYGTGPIRSTLSGSSNLVEMQGDIAPLLNWNQDFGILTFALEVGALLFLLYLFCLRLLVRTKISSLFKGITIENVTYVFFIFFTLHYNTFFTPCVFWYIAGIIVFVRKGSSASSQRVHLVHGGVPEYHG